MCSKEIQINKKRINFSLKKSRRARYMRLSVRKDLSVTVTVPWRFDERMARDFVVEKSRWLLGKLEYFEGKKSSFPEPNRKDYLRYKDQAKLLVEKKLVAFNGLYNFSWKKIVIRNPITRWGSCSEKGNLNFSYRLVFLPEDLQDYIIVHELCHLGQFNHSQNFWSLVGQTIPDYQKKRSAIRAL
ncbi:MAG TPA: YgjP-like metallopeptidase domain-containing protein [Candidatus Bathyarchaeia archaeon]|nr:YgjP-like metallopeptidase domain-containing protein [Candidatus Bathyarchaeia archaeon]